MKEQIIIKITNLDDFPSVLEGLNNLFAKLISYYGKKDVNKAIKLVVSCATYFDKVLELLGYDKEDFEEIK
jgi:lantibiotic modifying enzyme